MRKDGWDLEGGWMANEDEGYTMSSYQRNWTLSGAGGRIYLQWFGEGREMGWFNLDISQVKTGKSWKSRDCLKSRRTHNSCVHSGLSFIVSWAMEPSFSLPCCSDWSLTQQLQNFSWKDCGGLNVNDPPHTLLAFEHLVPTGSAFGWVWEEWPRWREYVTGGWFCGFKHSHYS